MTYEEKLHKVVFKLNEERAYTRTGYKTKVTFNDASFSRVRIADIAKILLKLQDDEKVLTIVSAQENLQLDPYDKFEDVHFEYVDVIVIELTERFDSWYESYLMGQKTLLENLDYINLLRIYDTVQDINEQIQLTHKTTVYIRLLPPVVRYKALFPVDTTGLRHQYCQNRLDSLEWLKEKDIIIGYSHGQNNWETIVTITFVLSKFDLFYKAIQEEYVKQSKSEGDTSKPINEKPVQSQSAQLTYDPQKGSLVINGKTVKLNKDSFRAKLLELLLKDDKSRKKEWSWDEVIEAIEGTKDEEHTKESKSKFYPACDGLSKHIASKIGVNDLLVFTKSTVRINSKYL